VRFDVLTLFPEMFAGPLDVSMIGRARERGLLQVRVTNIRDFAAGRHKVADDYSYGGGAGMVMKPEPIFGAVEAVRCPPAAGCRERVILLTPQGVRLTQGLVQHLAAEDHLVLVCGHYEGVDERVRQALVTDEISVGDYVLTGGELPAMVVIDAVSRLLPGVLGAEASALAESFAEGLLEYPQWTRPVEFRGMRPPDVLLSGNHEQVRRWRRKQALRRTLERRPDLLEQVALGEEDLRLLAEVRAEMEQAEHAADLLGE